MTPSPKDILDASRATYLATTTYSDSGEARWTSNSPLGQELHRTRFATAFVARDRFRFHFANFLPFGIGWVHGVVCRNGLSVRRWWHVPSLSPPGTLGDELSSFAGVSTATSVLIPRLLLPRSLPGPSILDIEPANVVNSASISGVDCYEVRGADPRSGAMLVLWIGATSHLVHRYFTPSRGAYDASGLTIEISPALDVTLDKALFALDAPNFERLLLS